MRSPPIRQTKYMTREICLLCKIRHLEHRYDREAFEGLFEFSVQETSKDLSQNGQTHHSKTGARSCHMHLSLVRGQDVLPIYLSNTSLVGDYMVTGGICMSLRRYVLKRTNQNIRMSSFKTIIIACLEAQSINLSLLSQ